MTSSHLPPHTAEADGSARASVGVLIVDDSTAVREGLSQLIAGWPGFRVVGAVALGAAAEAHAASGGVDVVLLDLSMPGLDPARLARRLRKLAAGIRIVVLPAFPDIASLTRVLEAGATTYVLKDAEPAELFAAVRDAARGRRVAQR